MAKDRVTPGDLAPAPELTPQAHPVDTFHDSLQAQPSGTNGGLQLAEALRGFQPGLAKYVDDAYAIDAQKQQQKNTNQEGQGAEAALENRQSFNDAIKNGVIRPAESPWFVKGFKNQQLRLNAMSYDEALRAAYAQSDVKNSNDPQAITGFIQDFTKTYTGNLELKDDPDFTKIFTPLANASAEQLVNLHAAYRSQQIEDQARNNTSQEAYKILDNHFIYAGAEGVGKALDAVAKSAMASGLSGTDANRQIVDAVTSAAKDNLDPSMLDALKHISAGSGSLQGTTYAREKSQEAESHIYRLQWEQEAHFNATAEKVKKQQADAIIGDTLPKLLANPLMDISPQVAQLAKFDPEKATSLASTKSAWIKNAGEAAELPETVANTWRDIYSGKATASDVVTLASQGKLGSITVGRMMEEIPKVAKNSDKLNDPLIRELDSRMTAAINGNQYDFTGEKGAKSAAASQAFNREMLRWIGDNPNASASDRYDEAGKLQNHFIKTFGGIDPAQPTIANPAQILADPAKAEGTNIHTDVMFTPGAFNNVVREYQATHGKAGTIVALANRLKVDPKDLMAAQNTLLGDPLNMNPKKSPAGGVPKK